MTQQQKPGAGDLRRLYPNVAALAEEAALQPNPEAWLEGRGGQRAVAVTLPFNPGAGKVLELGCGDSPIRHDATWQTLDMRKLPTVDYVGDLEEKWPVPDESYVGVFGKFVIEHVSWRKTSHFASECFRVLKPGGSVMMVSPNTLEQCKEIARLGTITEKESALIFGGQEERGWNEHKAAFSPEWATKLFREVGFQRVEIETWPGQIWTGARTDMVIRAWKTSAVQAERKVDRKVDQRGAGLTNQPWYKEMEAKMQPQASPQPPQGKKLGLNVGSFTVMTKPTNRTDWWNVDILDLNGYAAANGFQFRQHDVRKGIPWAEHSVDFVVASHFLEHITRAEGDAFLKECFRVLKPDGVLRITVPDVKLLAASYGHLKERFSSNEGVKNAQDEAEAMWNFLTAGHLTAYDQEALAEKLDAAGFTPYQCKPQDSNSPEIAAETKDMYPDHSLYIEGVKSAHAAAKTAALQVEGQINLVTRLTWATEQLRDAKTVVDIGCYDAPITLGMTNCTWVDVMPYEHIAAAIRVNHREPFPREKFVQSNAIKLPFSDKQFEVALMSELLEHAQSPVDVLREAWRVAHKLVITVPNEHAWDPKLAPFTNPGHIWKYDEAMLRQHLVEAGIRDFTVGRLDYHGWSYLTALAGTATAPVKVGDRKLRIGLMSTRFFGCPPNGYSGLEMVCWDAAAGLAELGHEVTLFAPEGSQAPPGGHVVVTGPALLTTNINWLQAEQEAYDIVKKHLDGLDILHGMNWFGIEYSAKRDHPGLPVCHTHHGGLNPDWWCKSKPPYKLNLIAISNWMQKVYQSQGMASKVVYNGIDMERYQFKKEKGERLLFVGRLSPLKQPDLAITVAKQVGMGLDIVGGTFVAPNEQPYLESIKAQADGKHVCLYEDAPHDVKVKLMQDAQCLLFPSNMGEPFGLVAAEAMACGTPVVATADGAIGEVVDNGVTGFLCKTLPEMVEAVKRVGTIMPESCRRRVTENFSRQVMARAYEKCYRDILAGQEW